VRGIHTLETSSREIAMRARTFDALIATGLLGVLVIAPATSRAVGPESNPTLPNTSTTTTPKPPGTQTTSPDKKKKKDAKKQQQSQIEFKQDFGVAYELIYTAHDYAAGIDKLHALKHDDDADVANLIGYASRKLGRYDDSKIWYEKALAADPQHARTWSYYGMWHAEQGNLLKAKDYLNKVASICGTGCREYTELKQVIEGTRTY
jgi:hypothetical protein